MYRKSLSYLKILVCAAFMMVTASAVSPSAEAATTQFSGDGLYFYNAVICSELPVDIPTSGSGMISIDWLDGGSYLTDYVLTFIVCDGISSLNSDATTFNFDNISYYDIYVYTPSQTVADLFGMEVGVWTYSGRSDETSTYRSSGSVAWVSSYYTSDGTLTVRNGRTPISLDGMTVIGWDGDTSDTASSGDFYRVSSGIDYPVRAYASGFDSDLPYMSVSGSVLGQSDNLWFLNGDTASDMIGWLSIRFVNNYSGYDGVADGLYFCKSNVTSWNRFVNWFAYEPAPDVPTGPDFSNTELIIHESVYDFQSGTVVVGWSNLPNIDYPDDIQYYITARLSDGNPPTHPYTYIGGSDDPPSGDLPIDFTFTDLQPETAYTVTVELRYASGDNASFSNSVSSGVTATVSFTTLSDGSISEGDKAIIDAIQNTNQQHEQWIDSEMGSAVGDLNEDVAAAEQQINDLNNQEEAFKDDAFARFQEVSASFSGFDGTVGSGIGLAGTLFSRFFNCLGDFAIIYTFPLILGLAMVIIGRLSRSSFSLEDKDHDQFTIDGW